MTVRSIGVALMVLVAAACASPASTPIATDPASPPPASPSAAAVAARNEWRAVSTVYDDPATAVGAELAYGRFGAPGRVFDRAFAPLRGDRLRWGGPVADGPLGGLIAVAFRDDDTTEIWTIDVETGAETKIAERAALISGLELDPRAGVVHLVETTLPLEAFEVVTLDLDSGAPTHVTTIPVADVAREHVATHLDPSTGTLLVLACGFTCELTGVDLAGGAVAWSRPSDHQALTSSLPGIVLASHTCGLPCATQLIDPVTGTGTRAADTCGSAVLGVRAGAPAIATDSDGETCRELGAPPTIHVWTDPWVTPTASRVIPGDLFLDSDGGETGFDVDPSAVLLVHSADDVAAGATEGRRLDLSSGALGPID